MWRRLGRRFDVEVPVEVRPITTDLRLNSRSPRCALVPTIPSHPFSWTDPSGRRLPAPCKRLAHANRAQLGYDPAVVRAMSAEIQQVLDF